MLHVTFNILFYLAGLCAVGIALGRTFALREARRELREQVSVNGALEQSYDYAKKAIRDRDDRIERGTEANKRLIGRVDEVSTQLRNTESQLMHALATMDSANKKQIEFQGMHADEFQTREQEYLALRVAFKETTDRLFINAEELRAENRGLLETVTTATQQLVTIAQEFAGLRRVGFMRGAEVAVNDANKDAPARFGSTDDADAASAKAGRNVVIDAIND